MNNPGPKPYIEQEEEMEFKDEIFQEGLNLTIRRGIKYANLKEGDLIAEGKYYICRVEYVKVKRFVEITPEELECHHVGNIEFQKAFQMMHTHYHDFQGSEIVTLVFFKFLRLDREPII